MCFRDEPGGPLDPPDFRYAVPRFDATGQKNCWDHATWLGYMERHGYWTKGDPTEDSDARTDLPKGMWLNPADRGLECTSKATHDRVSCADGVTVLYPAWKAYPPRERKVTRACPTPTPPPQASPTPGPTPTPNPNGCPALLKVGGMFLSAVDCGNCRKQGYLGVRVNVTSTELCREGDPGCVCDPARNRCEMPRDCQNPLGATVYLTLPGKFENDLCDANSDNPFNCHHKPKADEAGETTFTYCPHNAAPDDPRCTSKCIDVREVGTREVACPSRSFWEIVGRDWRAAHAAAPSRAVATPHRGGL